MKKIYYFRSQNAPLSAQSVIYHIAIGQSEREREYYKRLKSMAYDTGYTLIPWDDSVDYYLTLEQERVFGRPCHYGYDFESVKMSITDLMRIIRTTGLAFYEKTVFSRRCYFKHVILKIPFNGIKRKRCPNGSKVPAGNVKT